jgi:ABC-type transporter Mla MlaB component
MASSGPSPIVLALSGPLRCSDVPELCMRVRAALDARGPSLVVCDVGRLANPDLSAVDLLARLQLTARRHGSRIRLRGARDDLRELLAFTGLAGGLGLELDLVRELERQAEEREDRGGVEEEGELGDSPV